jgi:hypothetical protein
MNDTITIVVPSWFFWVVATGTAVYLVNNAVRGVQMYVFRRKAREIIEIAARAMEAIDSKKGPK